MADQIEHLAALAEQAGKLRTAEWLRTCALLPPEQWPPAPAYKGPMVPAAERDALQARIEQIRAVLDAHYYPDIDTGTEVNVVARITSIVDSAPPALRVLVAEHVYALSVARSAVLKAARKFVAAADMYRRRDLVRSVQEMADSERACVRVASFLADEIVRARAEPEVPGG